MSVVLNKIEYVGNLLSPLPVILVGANVDDRPNYLVIGYICPFDFGRSIFFSLYKGRYTRKGIHQNKTFSVNVPSVENLDGVKICGAKSGAQYDKSNVFKTYYGELKTAPLIEECPINIECRLEKVIDYGRNEGIIGKVVKTYVAPECIENGKLDALKVNPIIWATGGDPNYYRLGEPIERGRK